MPDSSLLHAPPAEVRVEARLTADQRARRDAHVQTIHDYQAKSLEAAAALAAIKDEGLHTEDGTFADFAHQHFGIGRSRAYQLAAAGRLYTALAEAGVSPLPVSEAQLRPLTKLGSFRAQRRAWDRTVGDGDGDGITMEDVLAAVREALGETARDHGDAAAAELRSMAPDELEVGRMLRRVREGSDDAAFERLVREEVGRSAAWAETAMAYAEACDGLEEGERPTVAEFERFERALRPLAPSDRTVVWKRHAARRADGATLEDTVGEVVAERAGELGLELAPPTGAGSEGSAAAEGARLDAGRPFTVVVDPELMEGDLRAGVTGAGEAIAPHAVLLDYGALPDGAVEATVEALRSGRDMPPDKSTDGVPADRVMLVKGQRQMVRVGFEPDLATWAWPVLVPAPNRFARAWLPASGAETGTETGTEQGAPCFVPRRLLQPTKTKRKVLSARDRARREAGTYLVDDEERHQSRVVLLAPGVDLTHGAVPDDCIRLVLEHAGAAADFVFLAVALDPERVAALDWPRNVRPVARVTTAGGVRRAVTAFAEASAEASAGADAGTDAGVSCRGIVMLEGARDPLVVDDALYDADGQDDEEALDPDLVRDHLAAVLVRGRDTSRDALRSALALRRYGVRVQVGREVRVREEEAVFDPAEFDPAELGSTTDSAIGRAASGADGPSSSHS